MANAHGEFIGRITFENDVLVGKYDPGLGVNIATESDESLRLLEDVYPTGLLLLNSSCTSEWRPFTLGDDLPQTAVIGGHQNGQPLYVVRITTVEEPGYYNSVTELAYIAGLGLHSDNLELLVVV